MTTTKSTMPLLGSIHCQYCGELIDTLDTEKVTVYYSTCSEPSCRTAGRLATAGFQQRLEYSED